MGEPRIETSPKRVRAVLAGTTVADSTRALLVWRVPHYPTYYFPSADVRTDLLAAQAREAVATDPEVPALREHLRIAWAAMDHWFEEDEEVFTHARDPYTRLDILASSRHVRLELDGTTVADSPRPHVLFETGLPPRYYLPKTDVRLDLLRRSDTVTHCPYKGATEYFTVRTPQRENPQREHPDIAWSYPTPLPESTKIAGLVCFAHERGELYLDGARQPRS